MAREYGSDLALIFIESQGSNNEQAEKFAWQKKWMGTDAIWSSESPFNTGSNGLPNFVLLSATGEVLLKGNPLSMHNAIEEAVVAEIEKAKGAPEGTPKALVKSYKAFAKGQFGKAIMEARKVAEKGGEEAEDATAAAAFFVEKVQAKYARADWMISNGFYMKADGMLNNLKKGVKGVEDFSETATELVGKLEADDMQEEMAAAKVFAKLEEKLIEDGLDDKLVKKLTKFASKYEGTKAGDRAAHIAGMADTE